MISWAGRDKSSVRMDTLRHSPCGIGCLNHNLPQPGILFPLLIAVLEIIAAQIARMISRARRLEVAADFGLLPRLGHIAFLPRDQMRTGIGEDLFKDLRAEDPWIHHLAYLWLGRPRERRARAMTPKKRARLSSQLSVVSK